MQNASGIKPVEFNVLVLPDPVATKQGGLLLPDEVVEQRRHAQTRGVIVAVSPNAFNVDVWPVGVEPPGPGAKVAYGRYAGTLIDGIDGVEYRVVKDKDIVAVIDG